MAIDVEKIRSSLHGWIADEAFHTIAGACGDLLRVYDQLVADTALDEKHAVEAEGDLSDLIESYVTEVCEYPDRTSPEDQPDMLLITADELRLLLSAFTDEIRALDQGE